MKFNSCFNFTLSKCIGFFGYYICGVFDCNEWKTETPRMHKYVESKTTWIKMATVRHVTSEWWDVQNFRLLDFCWTGCTQEHLFVLSGSTKNWRLTVVILVVGQYTETKCTGEICIIKVKGEDLVPAMEARSHLHTLAIFLPGNELAIAYW
jgi:hypothetical protein